LSLPTEKVVLDFVIASDKSRLKWR